MGACGARRALEGVVGRRQVWGVACPDTPRKAPAGATGAPRGSPPPKACMAKGPAWMVNRVTLFSAAVMMDAAVVV
jgi:hypothetical protein